MQGNPLSGESSADGDLRPTPTERRARITLEIVERTGIDDAMIELLVGTFYRKVRADPLLGPIFEERIGDWANHLERMCAFWSSVALMSGRYHGRPMEKHLPLPVDARHFDRWLELFEETAQQVCPPSAAAHFVERARNIAESLELGIAAQGARLLMKGERLTTLSLNRLTSGGPHGIHLPSPTSQAPVTHNPALDLTQTSRSERLRRWSKLLEDHPEPLTTLEGTEHYSSSVRDQMSKPGSALSVAFADPLLRSAGLEGETYGAAKRFFQLTDGQLHYIVCHCHVGSQMSGRATARRVRCADPEAGLFGRVLRSFSKRSGFRGRLSLVANAWRALMTT